MVTQDDHENPDHGWNVEGENLAFIRDEGLNLLALFRKIEDPKKRQMIIDLIGLFAGESLKS